MKEFEERTQATEETPRPLKRLRRKYQDGQTSSAAAPNPSGPRMPLLVPKDEPTELPESSGPSLNASKSAVESHQTTAEKNKGKQPTLDPSPPAGDGSSPHQMIRNGSVPPQIPCKEKRPVPESSHSAACPKKSTVEPSTVVKQKSIPKHQLLIPKDEPVTDDMPNLPAPLAVIHPGMPSPLWLNYDIISRCCIL